MVGRAGEQQRSYIIIIIVFMFFQYNHCCVLEWDDEALEHYVGAKCCWIVFRALFSEILWVLI